VNVVKAKEASLRILMQISLTTTHSRHRLVQVWQAVLQQLNWSLQKLI